MEAKMALIEILRNFKIELAPETKVCTYMCACTYGWSVQIRLNQNTDVYIINLAC